MQIPVYLFAGIVGVGKITAGKEGHIIAVLLVASAGILPYGDIIGQLREQCLPAEGPGNAGSVTAFFGTLLPESGLKASRMTRQTHAHPRAIKTNELLFVMLFIFSYL
jgi:hypothetical protein